MRFILSLIVLALVTACATAPAAPAASNTSTTALSAGASRVGQLLAAAGSQNAPTQSEVVRALGQPAITRQDGAGAALTYRFENCALLLLFAADQRNAMRLSEAHPSARRAGAAAPTLEECAAEARS